MEDVDLQWSVECSEMWRELTVSELRVLGTAINSSSAPSMF